MARHLQICSVVVGFVLLTVVRVEWYVAGWNGQTLLVLAQGLPEKGKKITVAGKVVADPDARDATLHAEIDVETIDGVQMRGKLIAFFPPDTELEYGEVVIAKGTLRMPDVFETETGVFDYPHYLQAHGISAMVTSARVVSATPAQPSILGSLFVLKHAFNTSLDKVFVPPCGALLDGIILGERRGIPPDLERAFIVSSLIHIVVLSGHVLTLIADAIMRTLSFLPNKMKYPLGAVCIVLFVLMVGASSTAVRAGIMALIGLLARFHHRDAVALRSLGIAAGAMALWNPAVVLWDPSFILSVLATFGLIVYSPVIEKWLTFVPKIFELRSIAASTLSVQVFILPMLLYYTGTLSFLALPANLLALPVLPWAMLAGFIAGALNLIPGTVGLMLAFVPAFFAQLFVRWIVYVAETTASIPYAATTIVTFPLWAALLCYVPLILAASWIMLRSVPQRATNLDS